MVFVIAAFRYPSSCNGALNRIGVKNINVARREVIKGEIFSKTAKLVRSHLGALRAGCCSFEVFNYTVLYGSWLKQ